MYHAAIREVMFDVCLAGLFDVGVNPELFIMWNKLDGCVCFFFQAEDGIRDKLVTGVQTCALPISVIGTVISAFALAVFAIRVALPSLTRHWGEFQILLFAIGFAGAVFLLFPLLRDPWLLAGA